MAPKVESIALNRVEAAHYLGLPLAAFIEASKQGELPSIRIEGYRVWHVETLKRFIDRKADLDMRPRT